MQDVFSMVFGRQVNINTGVMIVFQRFVMVVIMLDIIEFSSVCDDWEECLGDI